MNVTRRMVMAAATAALVVVTATPASAHRPAPVVRKLAIFGVDPANPDQRLGSGSTVGPDGALYVTDGNNGNVLRVDPRSGAKSIYASGLPPKVLGIGGAMDAAFVGHTLYVLVTMVSGDLLPPVGPAHFGDDADKVGIYRLERDGTFTVVADIGAWAVANKPTGDYFITTGVQYALQPYRGGFLVTDGHHNRVLRVSHNGEVSQLMSFGDIVPTGLETSGNTVFLAEAGPVPHQPKDAKVVALTPRATTVTEVGSGRGATGPGLTVDVERGPRHALYALLQGVWDLPPDPANAGSPASHDSGVLVRIEHDGSFTNVVDELDQPTSLEFIGDTAFVVTLTGTILRIDHVSTNHSR
jgi:hypothetical protein